MGEYSLLIDGELVDSATSFAVLNPATGEKLADCPKADEALLNLAVKAADKAFPAWAALSMAERCDALFRLADELEAALPDLIGLLVAEQGKPKHLAQFELGKSLAMLRAFAAMDLPTEILHENDEERILVHYTPLGVVAAIVPWNFPIVLLMVKLAPALVAGNTLIIKPAPTTPLATLKIGELCQQILPPGVVNIVTDENELGPLISAHPDIRKIAFTGSTPTGRKVMEGAAPTLKRLTLELGGNDAALVLDDVDVKTAAAGVFRAAMLNSGQICFSAKRVYVPEALYDEFCDELAALARSAKVGEGMEDGVEFGPIQNRLQLDRVLDLIEDSRITGTIIAGGKQLDRPGFFVALTIVRDVGDDARIVREEQFGPVLPVLRYGDIDEAIRRVNDSEFGLAATIWTSNPERAEGIAKRIDVGTVWVNKHLDVPFDIPVRGSKQSGIGVEFGIDGLKEFTQPRIINIKKAG